MDPTSTHLYVGATIVIALATVVNVFVAVAQWRAMRFSTLHATRAWVFGHSAVIKELPAAGGDLVINLAILNTGGIPATVRIAATVSTRMYQDGKVIETQQDVPGLNPGIVAPKSNITVEIRRKGTPDMGPMLQLNLATITVHGSVTYDDIFKKGRISRFSLSSHPDGLEFTPSPEGNVLG